MIEAAELLSAFTRLRRLTLALFDGEMPRVGAGVPAAARAGLDRDMVAASPPRPAAPSANILLRLIPASETIEDFCSLIRTPYVNELVHATVNWPIKVVTLHRSDDEHGHSGQAVMPSCRHDALDM